MTEIHGHVANGFEGVRDAFAANFERDEEVGAAVAAIYRGEKVVDLWAGSSQPHEHVPWEEETIAMVFSTTKGMTALCAHILADRGELDFDAKVTDYWPEFAAEGKADIPVSWLFCHKTGLVDIDGQMSLGDALSWDPVVDALAAQKPHWEPGTQHGYHAVTYGWLAGEIVRRVSGKSLGEFFRDEVAVPLGLHTWIGLPEAEEHRVAPIIPMQLPELDGEMQQMAEMILGAGSMLGRALAAPGGAFAGEQLGDMGVWNKREIRAAEIGAANGCTTARSLARMYAATVSTLDGVRLLSPEQVKACHAQQTEGPDTVLMHMDIQYGLGFMLPTSMMVLGGPDSFGHYGAGGSVGFADPDLELGFGYIMNKMFLGMAGDERSGSLIRAVYDAVG